MRHFVVAVALAAPLLAGCGSSSSSTGDQPAQGCPRVAVLKDLQRLTEFREGDGRDVTDRRFEMVFAGLDSTCTYDKTGVTVEITVQIQATPGLANREPKVKAQYFAALMDPSGQIVEKEPFEAEAELKERRGELLSEELRQRIPLTSRNEGPRYSVLFGFQLTPAQLEYVHRVLGR